MIFYFSAEGNSKYVAERIAEATGEKVISIIDCVKNKQFVFDLKDGENLGFVTPVYYWELPEYVGNFINKCQFNLSYTPYVYYVATYAMNTGVARTNIKVDLKAKKLKLNAEYGVITADTNISIYYANDIKENNKREEKAETTINEIIIKIQNKEEGEFIKDIAAPLAAKISHAVYEKARLTSKFSVTDNCNGCGLCEEICPECVIKIENNKPKWISEKCLMCFACLHRCPRFAIRYGKNSEDKGQYINPKSGY